MPGFDLNNADWKELIGLLSSHEVEFLIVGAHAVVYYSRPRFTTDLDLFIRNSESNVARLFDALSEFGLEITREETMRLTSVEKAMIVFGIEPHRVDVLNFQQDLDFETAWRNRVTASYLDMQVPILALADLLHTKLAAGRPQDLADVATLEAISRQQKSAD